MNVSPSFSPPISLMKPYFLLAGGFHLLSILLLFFLNPFVEFNDFSLIGWVHIYMLGFVMMGIFAAMAQLGPIIVEREHFYVNIFKYLWILLSLSILVMAVGFFIYPTFLLYGGILVLITMALYAGELLLTLKQAKRKTSIVQAMKMSNLFLLIGIVTGLSMAAAFNGFININPDSLLKVHTFGLLVGFVILLIMGISIVLIPMFGSSVRISENEFKASFYTVTCGVIMMIISPLFLETYLVYLSYATTITAILLYLYQLYRMRASRKKITYDIWTKSMYVAFLSFVISFILFIIYLVTNQASLLSLAMWLMLIGFFGFVLIGNFYKVIPFLVWFHLYSPLIEKQAVPMLHELVPDRLSSLQWFYALAGLLISTLGIYLENYQTFIGGVLLLSISSSLFLLIINRILNSK